MGLHTETKIYQAAYGLLGVATEHVKNMPRSVKPIFGVGICTRCLELVLLIADANSKPNQERLPLILEILQRVVALEVLMRLCHDKKYISVGQYSEAIALTTSVGRQANGWKKWSEKQHE
jgi:hypothetical protein